MKKITMYVSALMVLGSSFALTSCVDDNESSSVKEVREAYANQLKAQAELLKAQIEADKIKDAVEVLLMQAQVDQVKSQTKLNEANAALAIAQTEIEKKKAAADQLVAAEELKSLQAKVKFELEEYKYKLEQVQIVAEIEMLKLRAELDKAKNQKDEVLNKAINDYKVYIGEVNMLKKTLAQAELDLAYNKAVLADLKITTAANSDAAIRMYNNWIVNTEASIANDKKMVANWNKILTNVDAAKLEKEIAEKTKEYEALLVAQSTIYKQYTTARTTFENGAKKALVDFQNLVGKNYTWNPMPNNMTYYTLEEINASITSANTNMTNYKAQIEANNKSITTLKGQTEALSAAKVKAETEANRLYALYEQARDAYYNDWSSANYDKMNTAYDKYRVANDAYDKAYRAYNSNLSSINTLEYQNSDLNYSLNSAQNALTMANSQKAAYGGDTNKPKVLADAYTAAAKIYDAAYAAYVKNDNEVRALSSYIQDLSRIYLNEGLIYSGENWVYSTSLEQIRRQVKVLEDRIVKDEADLAQYKRDINNVKELNKLAVAELDQKIKDAEAEIATLKTLLPIAEKQASEAKAIIDVRMK